MEQSKYINLSSKISLFNQLQATNNNIANSNTTGYKGDIGISTYHQFKDLVFSNDISTISDNSVGTLTKTDSPLDVAFSTPDSYFAVESPQGIRYTRDGNFSLNAQYQLVNKNGFPLLNPDGKIISVDTNEPQKLFIDISGVIFGDGKALERIGVFFANPTTLHKEGDSLLQTEEEAVPAEKFQMLQGMLEESNVISIKEMTNLIDISRSFDQSTNSANNINKLTIEAIQVLLKAD